ncbi:PrsW family intramembrane metalloprotease [Agromyces mariniharenae]|uniref:PrsW family intramembrane metalloprotease n=1 Tax=Agromyces mariniharenae TaxID=2604423 RepID=A0A5S4V6V8_9MICO|nr:PrsW family intramembrane metalloprotease [Agromyces mariniharenae]TYL52320.1 PrsW family intramembrane metalloprotease [Agromyces mariniharenae]
MSNVPLQPPPANPSPAPPLWSAPPPKGRTGGIAFAVTGIVIAGAVGLLVLGYLAVGLGVSTLAIGAGLAVLPLVVVLLTIRWVDRWEPEPRWALWFAFLWGAAVSVAFALVVDLGIQLAVAYAESGATLDEAMQAVVQAPIVEETAKGIGVLLIYAFSRSHFDGPVDGLVYGATVAAGFAFTENILYFGAALIEGGAEELGATFVVRGIFSPFAHVLFTACTGIAIGIGARRGGGAGVIGWFLFGLTGAILLHALWNGSLAFADDAIGLYFTVQVPIFIGFILVTVFLRREEVRVTRTRLAEYGAAGWFSPAEVQMLATPAGRRQARAWARVQSPPRTAEMRRLITDATHLAFTRQRLVTGRAGLRSSVDEDALLRAVAADRASLVR